MVDIIASTSHIEFSDGTLLPTKMHTDFARFPQLELHLLTLTPEKYVKAAADAGYKRLIAHVEANDPRLFLDAVKYEHVEAGLAIDAPTELEHIEPFLEEVDFVVVLTAEAGSDVFLPECLEKIRALHAASPNLCIAAEGGITQKTAKLVGEAGATRIVTGEVV